ncbi:hypothetical protein [Yoonia maritima]|nr:hypothetical protein [Yoonia maritima]
MALALSACGGSDSSPVVGETGPVTYVDFNEMSIDAQTLSSQYIETDGRLLIERSSAENLPTTGAASYYGFVTGTLEGQGLIGQIAVTADFEGDAITGTASNFIHETNGAYSGTLTAAGLVRTEAHMVITQFSATLEGTLSNDGNDYVTEIALEGDFLTADHAAIGGNVVGYVGDDFLVGGFAAER